MNPNVSKNLTEAERLLTEALNEPGIDDQLFGELASMVRKLRLLAPKDERSEEARVAASYDTTTRVHTLGEVPSVR